MRKKGFFYFISFIAIILCSCSKDDLNVENHQQQIHQVLENSTKRLKFDSKEEVEALINSMKDDKDGRTKVLTRASSDFVSLNDYLRQNVLDSLTPEELAIVKAEGLEFDPDDEIIADPYFCDLLNAKREIEVDGKIYKFSEKGIFRCNADEADLLEDIDKYSSEISLKNTDEFITIKNSLEFVSRNFLLQEETPITKARSGTNRGNLVLGNKEVINMADIRDMEYKGRGDAGKVQNWISSKLGNNTIVEVNFTNKRRMKLRMFEQNYILYNSIGMTVRMQKKRLKIWWRTKADEFRFGWKNIELSHKFKDNPITNIEVLDPRTGMKVPKVPDYIKAKFPFSDKENVLFTVPFGTYKTFTMGDVNELFWKAMNTVASSLKNEFKNLNQGTYSVENKQGEWIVYSLIPQKEIVEKNTGREIARFDLKWFQGSFKVGLGINGNNGKVHIKNVSASPKKAGGIHRGEVYAAVKYHGRWKAARIYTVD